ncbi:hypothetical protein RFI_39400, partial [Reticulomyxa filosa]
HEEFFHQCIPLQSAKVAEKEITQCKSNTPKTTTSFEKKVILSLPKQIRLPIVISPDIGNIQVDVVDLSLQSRADIKFLVISFNLLAGSCFYDSEKQGITKLAMNKFGMKLKSSSFLELSSAGKISDTKYKKTEEKSQVNVRTINTMIFGM